MQPNQPQALYNALLTGAQDPNTNAETLQQIITAAATLPLANRAEIYELIRDHDNINHELLGILNFAQSNLLQQQQQQNFVGLLNNQPQQEEESKEQRRR